ncbi:MAG TPA: glycosyltransferase family 2 protein [Planctomycetota bacterium]|nr:glycosyltransferase family 2 protein [Planctomycetota bacterium]
MENREGLPFISVVVPVYNEEQVLPKFLTTMTGVLKQVSEDFEIIFAADPCADRTFEIIREANAKDPRIKMLALSRRFGQPAATMAGLAYSRGQVVVVIDCDMQDPPQLIPEMVKCWRDGFKVVIPQRRSRTGEHPFKKLIAYSGYWFINKIANVKIPRNTGDFRLLDRRVVNELVKLNESHGFLRGLVAVVGFKTHLLPFDREARDAGEGKYNRITGSLRIGFNGIVAFSDYLLSLMVMVGFCISAFAVVCIVIIVVMKLTGWQFQSGIPSIMILILMMGGLQMMSMGVLGAYIGRIYDEAKRRPKFIVEEAVGLTAPFDAGN